MTHKITLAEVLAAAKPATRKRILAAIDPVARARAEAKVSLVTITVDPKDASYEAFSEAYDAALKKLGGTT